LAAFSDFTDLPEDDCPDTLITDLLAAHVNGKLETTAKLKSLTRARAGAHF
jgi:hypothetical protein